MSGTIPRIKTGENVLFAALHRIDSYLIHTLLFSCLFPVGRIPPYLSILWWMWYTERDVVFGIICAGIRCGDPRMKSLMGRIMAWGRAGISRPDDVLIDFSSGGEDESHAMSWLISQCTHQYTSNNKTETEVIYGKVRSSYLLSCIMQKNKNVGLILHAPSFISVSEKIARIVMANYSRNWNVSELASMVLMSESSLKRRMYEEVGSISTFIHKIKLTEALRKLRRTNTPISVISSELGYSSPSYFSKVFFKYLNTYPQNIRKKNSR
ncbi:hypothetical protein A313_00099 [Escherichia coli KTE147]|nr:hypothetical protein A313_00099 [Escherichia coli KTE147]